MIMPCDVSEELAEAMEANARTDLSEDPISEQILHELGGGDKPLQQSGSMEVNMLTRIRTANDMITPSQPQREVRDQEGRPLVSLYIVVWVALFWAVVIGLAVML